MISNDEFEVDVPDVEYQCQAGKPWLARIYQRKGTGPFVHDPNRIYIWLIAATSSRDLITPGPWG